MGSNAALQPSVLRALSSLARWTDCHAAGAAAAGCHLPRVTAGRALAPRALDMCASERGQCGVGWSGCLSTVKRKGERASAWEGGAEAAVLDAFPSLRFKLPAAYVPIRSGLVCRYAARGASLTRRLHPTARSTRTPTVPNSSCWIGVQGDLYWRGFQRAKPAACPGVSLG